MRLPLLLLALSAAAQDWTFGPDHTDTTGPPGIVTAIEDGSPLGFVHTYWTKGGYVTYVISFRCENVETLDRRYVPPPGPMWWLVVIHGLPLVLALMARVAIGGGR